MPFQNKELRTAIVIFIIPFIVNVSVVDVFHCSVVCVCVL